MLTVKQAAEELRVTPERVRNMIYAGTLPAQKFGNNWSISRYDVKQRLASKPKRGRPKKTVQNEVVSYHIVSLNSALYEECRTFMEEYGELQHVLQTNTKEEQEFFIMLWNFFLQQKQEALIKQGVY